MLARIKLAVPLIIFIIIILFLWKGIKQNPHHIPSPLINKVMPAFSANSLKQPNKILTNRLFYGHITLLNVFATWCLSCRAEHPVIMNIKETTKLKLIGLNYKDKRSAATQWLKQYGDPYSAVIFDPKGKLGINLGVYGTPETFVIDAKGVIRYKYIGPISPTQWKNVLLPEIQRLERLPV